MVLFRSRLGTFLSLWIVTMLSLRRANGESDFCEVQQREFDTCSERVQYYYIFAHDLETVCHEMFEYLACVHKTNLTCPQLEIFHDEAFLTSVERGVATVEHICPDQQLNFKCSGETIDYLMSECHSIINEVQDSTPREEMCSINQRYYACLQRTATGCKHDATFLEYNMPLALNGAASAVKDKCDDVQADSPSEPGTGHSDASAYAICSEETINASINECNKYLIQPASPLDSRGCSVWLKYSSCLDVLDRNCPNMHHYHGLLAHGAKTQYEAMCLAKCPDELANGFQEIGEYCLGDLFHMDIASSHFCPKMEAVPICMETTELACPGLIQEHDKESLLEMINSVLHYNCHTQPHLSDTEKRDVDIKNVRELKSVLDTLRSETNR